MHDSEYLGCMDDIRGSFSGLRRSLVDRIAGNILKRPSSLLLRMASLRLAHHALKIPSLARPRIIRASVRSASSSSQAASSSSLWSTGLYTTVFAVSTGLLAVYYFDSRSAIHRYVLTPLLRYTLDPEAGHKLAVKVIGSGLGPKDTQGDDEILKAQVRLSITCCVCTSDVYRVIALPFST